MFKDPTLCSFFNFALNLNLNFLNQHVNKNKLSTIIIYKKIRFNILNENKLIFIKFISKN